MSMLSGGRNEVKEANEETQSLCDAVRPSAEEIAGKRFESFVAKSYKREFVAGTNLFIKVHVGGDEYVHLRVFRPLPSTGGGPELVGTQDNKTRTDPIEFF